MDVIGQTNIFEIFALKKKRRINTYECQVLSNLLSVYSQSAVLSCINRSKDANLKKISFFLMRLAGFPDYVPTCLEGLVKDRDAATMHYSETQILIADKLRIAERIQPNTEILSMLTKDQLSPSILWEKYTLRTPSLVEKNFICSSIRVFGLDLVVKSIMELPKVFTQNEKNTIRFCDDWLKIAAERDWISMEQFCGSLPNGVPYPYPLRLGRYHGAKTNHEMSNTDKEHFWKILKRISENDLIFNMSCLTGNNITPERVEWLSFTNEERQMYEECYGYNPFISSDENEDNDDEEDLANDEEDSESFIFDDEGFGPNYADTVSDKYYDYSDFDPESLDSDDIMNS